MHLLLLVFVYNIILTTYIIVYSGRNVKLQINNSIVKFTEYYFLKEEAQVGGLTPDIELYIDSKFEEIEARLQEFSAGSKYNVLPAGDGLLDIIDIDKKSVIGKISYQGSLISARVVVHRKYLV